MISQSEAQWAPRDEGPSKDFFGRRWAHKHPRRSRPRCINVQVFVPAPASLDTDTRPVVAAAESGRTHPCQVASPVSSLWEMQSKPTKSRPHPGRCKGRCIVWNVNEAYWAEAIFGRLRICTISAVALPRVLGCRNSVRDQDPGTREQGEARVAGCNHRAWQANYCSVSRLLLER